MLPGEAKPLNDMKIVDELQWHDTTMPASTSNSFQHFPLEGIPLERDSMEIQDQQQGPISLATVSSDLGMNSLLFELPLADAEGDKSKRESEGSDDDSVSEEEDEGSGSDNSLVSDSGSESDKEQDTSDPTPVVDDSDPARFLEKFSIAVDPTYRMTICIPCCSPIPWKNIYNHITLHHHSKPGSLRCFVLPPEDEIHSSIKTLKANEPLFPVAGPIHPIEGVAVKKGRKCSFVDCEDPVHCGERQMRRHFEDKHPGMDRRWTEVDCQTLDGRKKYATYIEVKANTAPRLRVLSLIAKAAEDTNLYTYDNVFEAKQNAWEKGSTIYHTQWDQLLNGVKTSQLVTAASTKEYKKDPLLVRLRKVTVLHFNSVINDLPKLGTLVARHIRTPDG